MQSDRDRTTYLFDVRQPAEFEAGHYPGSLNAPGGQLVQATDTYAAVRGARIVLIDRHEVQSVMTAHWLLQMGWTDVFVLRGALDGPLQTGAATVTALGQAGLSVWAIESAALSELIALDRARVIDVGDSFGYRRAHVPGAWYAMRSRLSEVLGAFSKSETLVFTCRDGQGSPFAAADAVRLGFAGAAFLKGGRSAWRKAGLPTEACSGDDDPRLLTPTDDMWYPPYARQSGVQEAMQQYLTWEVNLLEQLEREPYLRFGLPDGMMPTL